MMDEKSRWQVGQQGRAGGAGNQTFWLAAGSDCRHPHYCRLLCAMLQWWETCTRSGTLTGMQGSRLTLPGLFAGLPAVAAQAGRAAASPRGICAPCKRLPPAMPCSEAALQWLGADVAVFVGDFGEESVQVRKLMRRFCVRALTRSGYNVALEVTRCLVSRAPTAALQTARQRQGLLPVMQRGMRDTAS